MLGIMLAHFSQQQLFMVTLHVVEYCVRHGWTDEHIYSFVTSNHKVCGFNLATREYKTNST